MKWEISDAAAFGEYQGDWDRLNDEGLRSPLFHSDFVAPLLETFRDDRKCVLAMLRSDSLEAMALLVRRRPGVWQTFQPSQAPLGAWLMRPGVSLEYTSSGLFRRLPGLVFRLGLSQLDPAFYSRPDPTSTLTTLDYIDTARVAVEGSFEEYWRQRGKNLRSNVSKQLNRLAKDGVRARLEVLRDSEQVDAGIQGYGDLESAGWKSTEGTAVHPGNAQGRFYASMLKRFCRRGHARIYRYFFDERLVACDLCIDHAGTLIVLKTTYDEREKAMSPAVLMRYEYFGQIFDDPQIRAIEFYGRVMEWHRKWTDDIRTLYHANVYRWGALASLRQRLLQRQGASAEAKREVGNE